jgi:hypothetical protein
MDPNAKPATICKDGHKRIWHTAEYCPLCGAVAWGKKMQSIAGSYQGSFLKLQRSLETREIVMDGFLDD